jgi:hypothetical protein
MLFEKCFCLIRAICGEDKLTGLTGDGKGRDREISGCRFKNGKIGRSWGDHA